MTPKQHAQGGDLPPVAELPVEPLADVVPITPPAPPAPSAGGVELVTVYAYGGIPLRRMIAVVDEHGEVLLHTAQVTTEDEVLAAWQRACEIMAGAFDDETGTYFLKHRRLDEQGHELPGPGPVL